MKPRNTAIVALLVVLLGAYLYWVERPAQQKATEQARILEFDPESVTRLELRTPDATMEIERRDDDWQITAPVSARADTGAVDTLVETAAEAEQKRILDQAADDLSPFGLAEPEAVLTLWVGDQALPALAVGTSTPIGFNAYARRGEEKEVLLTSGTVRSALVKKLSDLRDKTIVEIAEGDVTSLTLEPRDGEAVRLERDEEGWRLTSPIQARASDPTVRNLLGSLRALRATDFVAESGEEARKERGLSPPALKVTATTGPDAPATVVQIGDEVEVDQRKLVAAAVEGESQIYLVASHVPASLGKSAADLRDKTILDVDADEVAEVRVRHSDGETLRLARQDDRWSLVGEEEFETDELVAQRFVDDLLGLQGNEIVNEDGDLAATGLDRPDFEIELADDSGDVLAALVAVRSGEKDASVFHAAARDGGPVYSIRDYTFTRIDKRPGDLITSDEDASITD